MSFVLNDSEGRIVPRKEAVRLNNLKVSDLVAHNWPLFDGTITSALKVFLSEVEPMVATMYNGEDGTTTFSASPQHDTYRAYATLYANMEVAVEELEKLEYEVVNFNMADGTIYITLTW